MKHLITQFYPVPCCLASLRSKHFPEQPVLLYRRTGHVRQYGARALYARCLRLQTHTHNMDYLLLFHCNNDCKNVTQCCVILSILLTVDSRVILAKENPDLVDSVHVADLLLKWSGEVSLQVIINYVLYLYTASNYSTLNTLFERFERRVLTIYDN